MREKPHLIGFNFWRYLINSWTVMFFITIILDFAAENALVTLLDFIAMIYIALLTIYVSDKEFERWYHRHDRQHPGEIFVIIWTVLVMGLMVSDIVLKLPYHLPTAVISSYIAVLTVLAVTRKSRQVYRERYKNKTLAVRKKRK